MKKSLSKTKNRIAIIHQAVTEIEEEKVLDKRSRLKEAAHHLLLKRWKLLRNPPRRRNKAIVALRKGKPKRWKKAVLMTIVRRPTFRTTLRVSSNRQLVVPVLVAAHGDSLLPPSKHRSPAEGDWSWARLIPSTIPHPTRMKTRWLTSLVLCRTSKQCRLTSHLTTTCCPTATKRMMMHWWPNRNPRISTIKIKTTMTIAPTQNRVHKVTKSSSNLLFNRRWQKEGRSNLQRALPLPSWAVLKSERNMISCLEEGLGLASRREKTAKISAKWFNMNHQRSFSSKKWLLMIFLFSQKWRRL